MSRLLCLLSIASALCGCGDRQAVAAPPTHQATHVDSILTRDEALRRFQASAPPVDSLSGGTHSRDSLVLAFVRALEAGDTTGLARLALDRAEFAYLYYPTAPQGLPPYDLAPDLLWFTLDQGTAKGLGRALEARGGRKLGFEGYRCDPTPSREGRNVVWGPCVVRERVAGRVREERLFGLIVEREGHYKFVSYGNKL